MLNNIAILLLVIGIIYSFYNMSKEYDFIKKDTHGHKL